MPLWDFICSKCDTVMVDVHGHKNDPDLVAPKHCGKRMEVILNAGRQSMQEFEAFETTHMHPDGKKILVRNSGELKSYQRQFGVYRVDDPGLQMRGGKLERKSDSKGRVYI